MMPLDITLAEWEELDAIADVARKALADLDSRLNRVVLGHHRDAEIVGLVTTIQSRLADAQHIVGSFPIVKSWAGNDNNGEPLFTPYEPNVVRLNGRLPHAIQKQNA
jgi:hypothetical protein